MKKTLFFSVLVLLAFITGIKYSESKIVDCDTEFIEPVYYGEKFQCVNNGRIITLAN